MAAKLISIIGPVAAGKTTLAECLAAELPADIIYEDYASNPFLAESFTGRDDLMLPSQLYFLLSRASQLSDVTWPEEGLFMSDYGFSQDRVFAAAKLSEADLKTYDYVSGRLARTIHPPSVMIHLDASVETLQKRIAKRGRGYEQTFTQQFLETLRLENAKIQAQPGCEIIRLNADETDFRQPAGRAEIIGRVKEVLANK